MIVRSYIFNRYQRADFEISRLTFDQSKFGCRMVQDVKVDGTTTVPEYLEQMRRCDHHGLEWRIVKLRFCALDLPYRVPVQVDCADCACSDVLDVMARKTRNYALGPGFRHCRSAAKSRSGILVAMKRWMVMSGDG